MLALFLWRKLADNSLKYKLVASMINIFTNLAASAHLY